jgi:hypothetical protein
MLLLNRRSIVKMLGTVSLIGFTDARRTEAQSRPTGAASPRPRPAAGDAGAVDMGRTFYDFEARAQRVVTRFADGSSVLSERTSSGQIETQTMDRIGNTISRFRIERTTDRSVQMVVPDASGQLAERIQAPQGLTPTLDWANVQARLYERDSVTDAPLEWRGSLLRRRGARPTTPESDIQAIEAQFDGGVSTVTRRGGESGSRATWTTTIDHYGLQVGKMRWSAEHRVLEWKFQGMERGYVNEERLARVGASWNVLPTMGWAGVQGLGFFVMHSKFEGRIALNRPRFDIRSVLKRLADIIVVPIHANDPGCDYLHWLDNTTLRPCCDQHDRCYAKNGCNQWSWFFWQSWSCVTCNVGVAYCFESWMFQGCDTYMLIIFGTCW